MQTPEKLAQSSKNRTESEKAEDTKFVKFELYYLRSFKDIFTKKYSIFIS